MNERPRPPSCTMSGVWKWWVSQGWRTWCIRRGWRRLYVGKTPFADEASRWPQAPCVMVELQEPYLLWLNGTTPTLEDVVNTMGGLGEGGWGEAEVSNLYNDSFKNVWQVHLYISSMKVMVTGVTTSWRLCSYASFRGMCCQVFRKMASTHMYSP